MELNLYWFSKAYIEWYDAPHGMKTIIAKKWSKFFGISLSTFHKYIKEKEFRTERKPLSDKEKRINPEMEKMGDTIEVLDVPGNITQI